MRYDSVCKRWQLYSVVSAYGSILRYSSIEVNMILTYLRNLIGSPPSGYEAVEYVVAGVVLVFLVSMAYRMIRSVFGGSGNRYV